MLAGPVSPQKHMLHSCARIEILMHHAVRAARKCEAGLAGQMCRVHLDR